MTAFIVVEGAIAICSQGTIAMPLNLEPGRACGACCKPIFLTSDHKSYLNIPSFGVCKMTGNPCIPVTPHPWLSDANVNISFLHTPVLIQTSTLECVLNGQISIKHPGQTMVSVTSPRRLAPLENSWRPCPLRILPGRATDLGDILRDVGNVAEDIAYYKTYMDGALFDDALREGRDLDEHLGVLKNDIRDMGILADQIYVFDVPIDHEHRIEGARPGSLQTALPNGSPGEIRITVGFQQRRSGTLPQVWIRSQRK